MKIIQKKIDTPTFRFILISAILLMIAGLCVRKVMSNKFEILVKDLQHIEINIRQSQKMLEVLRLAEVDNHIGSQDNRSEDKIDYKTKKMYFFKEISGALDKSLNTSSLTVEQIKVVQDWNDERGILSHRVRDLKQTYDSMLGFQSKSKGVNNLQRSLLDNRLKMDIGLRLKSIITEATVVDRRAGNKFKSTMITNYLDSIRLLNIFYLATIVTVSLVLVYVVITLIGELWDGKFIISELKKTDSI